MQSIRAVVFVLVIAGTSNKLGAISGVGVVPVTRRLTVDSDSFKGKMEELVESIHNNNNNNNDNFFPLSSLGKMHVHR